MYGTNSTKVNVMAEEIKGLRDLLRIQTPLGSCRNHDSLSVAMSQEQNNFFSSSEVVFRSLRAYPTGYLRLWGSEVGEGWAIG